MIQTHRVHIPGLGFINDPRWRRKLAYYPLQENSTSNQILFTLHQAVSEAESYAFQYRPNTLLLPSKQIETMRSRFVNGAGTLNLLDYFVNNNPVINNIVASDELSNVGPSGEDVAITYTPYEASGVILLIGV